MHGILRCPPPDGSAVLVAGAGIIGLATVVALRALFPSSKITVLAKHDHQAGAAERLGAKHVVTFREGGGHVEELARIAGTHVIGAGEHQILAGGFPYVVEAVGTARSVTEALRCTDGRGSVVLLGLSGLVNVDLTPIWLKEISLVGAVIHGPDPAPHGGSTAQGQTELLRRLGVSEQSVGAPIEATMETVNLGRAQTGAAAHVDTLAFAADGIIVLGGVKAHPENKAGVASGLLKMTTVGLGKQAGAQQAHSHGLWESVKCVPEVTLASKKILVGVAVVQNASRHPAMIEVVEPTYRAFRETDERLLKAAEPYSIP